MGGLRNVKVKGLDIYIPPLTRNDNRSGNDTRWRSASSGSVSLWIGIDPPEMSVAVASIHFWGGEERLASHMIKRQQQDTDKHRSAKRQSAKGKGTEEGVLSPLWVAGG